MAPRISWPIRALSWVILACCALALYLIVRNLLGGEPTDARESWYALASVVGSLVPQWPNSPERVVRYQLDHPLVGALYGRAGLFDVYGSWWFVLITALLFVSLVACLFPRTRALVRTLRQKPMQAREMACVERVGAAE